MAIQPDLQSYQTLNFSPTQRLQKGESISAPQLSSLRLSHHYGSFGGTRQLPQHLLGIPQVGGLAVALGSQKAEDSSL